MEPTDEGVLVYMRGGPRDGEVRRLPDARDRWLMPHRAEQGVFFYGTSCGPLPQPSVYDITFPREYEAVLTADVIVKKGTRLQDFETPYDWALVYDCTSEGGR